MKAPTQPAELPASPRALTRALLAWYRVNRRALPWRGPSDPYAIWISEVMLQQTQAVVVAPYYARFLARFPSARALAAAELPEVLSLWSGLGYYARARTLHAAARRIAADGFPRTLEGLRALPGFGPYTAAAVGSIAFGLLAPAVDGNAVRVYARLLGLRAPRAQAEPILRAAVQPLFAEGAAGDLNQAIMDLGQLVCTARAPRCLLCPWQASCRARRDGATQEIPVRTPPKARRPLTEVAVYLRRGEALLVARRRERGLFGGLWELPGGEAPPSAQAAQDLLARELGLTAVIGAPLATVSQVLTHRDLTLSAYAGRAGGKPRPTPEGRYLEARYVKIAELGTLGLSSATRRLLEALGISVGPARQVARRVPGASGARLC